MRGAQRSGAFESFPDPPRDTSLEVERKEPSLAGLLLLRSGREAIVPSLSSSWIFRKLAGGDTYSSLPSRLECRFRSLGLVPLRCTCQDVCSDSGLSLSLPPQFINVRENGESNAAVSDRAVAELWLQHSLQFHCLSGQLRPLLGDRQYVRKFYTGEWKPPAGPARTPCGPPRFLCGLLCTRSP